MLNISPEQRLDILTDKIPAGFVKDDDRKINPYIILDPAGEHRKKLAGRMNASFLEMRGIFPADLSAQLELDNVEPQLMELNSETAELMELALEVDTNAIQFIYSALSAEELTEQLKPQIHIIVENTEAEGFLAYWDPRVFMTLAELFNTQERKQAFMGNIYGVGVIDEEEPDKLKLYHMNDDGKFILMLNPKIDVGKIKSEPPAYVPFATPMIYTGKDKVAFMNAKSDKQVRKMVRKLIKNPLVIKYSKEPATFDNMIDNARETVKYAMRNYHMEDTDALYQFMLASHLLNIGFEKGTELEKQLQSPEITQNHKSYLIKQHIIGALENTRSKGE